MKFFTKQTKSILYIWIGVFLLAFISAGCNKSGTAKSKYVVKPKNRDRFYSPKKDKRKKRTRSVKYK